MHAGELHLLGGGGETECHTGGGGGGGAFKPQSALPTPSECLRTTDGSHLAIRNPQALCHNPHVRCGGEHPPNFASVGMTDGETRRGRHGRDAKGQGARGPKQRL